MTDNNFVPEWLDRSCEISQDKLNPPGWVSMKANEKALGGILLSFKALFEIPYNLTLRQVVEVTANSAIETGWFKSIPAFNLGGWKITKIFVENYKVTHGGKYPSWWRAAGHIASGDPPICYYRGFKSANDFYEAWIKNFVPKSPPTTYRYYDTSQAFWGNINWFRYLCLAGYKGPVTQASPEQSIKDFADVCRRVKVMFSQYVLGVNSDGDIGPKTKAALKNFQGTNNLEITEELNEATFVALVLKWKKDKMPLSFILSI